MSKALRKLVLNRILKTPVQLGYSPEAWDSALGALESPSEEDLRIHKAAIFFGDQLASLRRRLESVPAPEGSATSKVRRAVGFVNREYLVLMGKAEEWRETGYAWADELILHEVQLAGGINSATFTQVVETIVDGLRFELAALSQDQPVASTAGSNIRPLIERANLSVFYHILEEQWLDCLHLGWQVQDDQAGEPSIVPADQNSAIDLAIAMHREEALNAEMAGRFFKLNQENPHLWDGGKDLLGITPEGSGKRRKYNVHKLSPEAAMEIHVTRFAALEPDLVPFLAEPLEVLGSLTPNEMLSIWSAMSSLAAQLANDLAGNLEVKEPKDLECFVPIEKEAPLLSALQRCSGLPREKCAKALEQLVWRSSRDSLWHRPLVRLEDHRGFIIVIPALKAPNLRRSIEYWLSQGDADLARRGEEYEKLVRREILSAISSNRLLNNSGALEKSLPPPDPSVGDIDLVFWIGPYILIGEVKCLLRPATAHEWFQFESRLNEAQIQATRKAEYTQNNLPWLTEVLPHLTQEDLSSIKVVPCVIVNTPLGSLRKTYSVPVVDLYILNLYLEQGYGIINASLDNIEHGEKVTFYSNTSEAGERILDFLRDPPHLRPLRQAVMFDMRRQPDFRAPQKWISHIFPALNFNHDPVDEPA